MGETKKLQYIGSENSESSARVIINQNFQLLLSKIDGAITTSVQNFSDLTIEKPLTPEKVYGWKYNSDGTFKLSPLINDGIKYIYAANEDLYVPAENQYIVHSYIYVGGNMTIDGELVIL